MKKVLTRYIVKPDTTISKAYSKMIKNKMRIIFICDKNLKIIGLVTDGDFKRAFWSNIDQENPISSIGKKNKFFFLKSKKYLKEKIYVPPNINHAPVIKSGRLVDIVFDIKNKKIIKNKSIKFSVALLAGGYGKRLRPLTNSIPKALVSFRKKTILDQIINRFQKFKMEKMYLALFYRKDQIQKYVERKKFKNIKFINENKATGTAGPLSKINIIQEHNPIIVTNCDTILDYNYNEILKFHLERQNHLTIVGFLFEQNINYGVLEATSAGELTSIIEKPKIKHLANCGFYIISPQILKLIKKNKYLDMNNFIKKLMKKKMKIGLYPVAKKCWTDLGTLANYKKFNKPT